MSKARIRRPSPATVIATLALIVAIGGTATAASHHVVVRRGDIAPGAVTMRSISKGAVTTAKLRKGAVTAGKLANGSVGPSALARAAVTAESIAVGAVNAGAIAPDAVNAGAIAPGAVYGGAIGTETVVTKSIADLDQDAHNGEWTPSNLEVALCGPGEALLGTGFAFAGPTNGEDAWSQVLPIVNGQTKGVSGRFVSDTGGATAGEIAAVCLK